MRIRFGDLKRVLNEARPSKNHHAMAIAKEAWAELLAYLHEQFTNVNETDLQFNVMFDAPQEATPDEVEWMSSLEVECINVLQLATGMPIDRKFAGPRGVRVSDKTMLTVFIDIDGAGNVMLEMELTDATKKPTNPLTAEAVVCESSDLSSREIETIFAEAFDEVVAYLKDNYDNVNSGVYDNGTRRIVSFDPPGEATASVGKGKLRFSPEAHDVTMAVTKEIENVLTLTTGFPQTSGGTSVFDGVRLDDFTIMTFHVMLSKHGHFKCTFELIQHENRAKKRKVESAGNNEASAIEEAWLELKQFAEENYKNVKFFDNGDFSMMTFNNPNDLALSARDPYALADIQHDMMEIVRLATGLKINQDGFFWYAQLSDDDALMCSVRYIANKESAYGKVRVELFPKRIIDIRDTSINEILDGFGNKSNGKDGVAGNLRNGVPTTGHTGENVLTDEEVEENKEKRAACVLIVAEDGKVLAVSRKDNPNVWGLPGGKVDPAETEEQAAARELQEETGLTAKKLSRVFSADDGEYVTTTFACEADGEIDTDESGVIRWVEPAILFDPTTSPFYGYNRALFKKLGRL